MSASLPGGGAPGVPTQSPRARTSSTTCGSPATGRALEAAEAEGAGGSAGRAGLGSAAVLNGEIYVFGGSVNDDSAVVGAAPPVREVLQRRLEVTATASIWEQVVRGRALGGPRRRRCSVVKGGWIYLLGGEKGFTCASNGPPPAGPPAACLPGDPGYPYFNDVWRTRDGSHWQNLTTSGAGWSPRPGHQCSLLKGDIVCFGGGFGQPPHNPMDMWASREHMLGQLLQCTVGRHRLPAT